MSSRLLSLLFLLAAFEDFWDFCESDDATRDEPEDDDEDDDEAEDGDEEAAEEVEAPDEDDEGAGVVVLGVEVSEELELPAVIELGDIEFVVEVVVGNGCCWFLLAFSCFRS